MCERRECVFLRTGAVSNVRALHSFTSEGAVLATGGASAKQLLTSSTHARYRAQGLAKKSKNEVLDLCAEQLQILALARISTHEIAYIRAALARQIHADNRPRRQAA
eukprot:4363589-Pleurochrysis_carterae.AAC.1